MDANNETTKVNSNFRFFSDGVSIFHFHFVLNFFFQVVFVCVYVCPNDDHSLILRSLFLNIFLQVVFVCMSALMMGVLPFTCFTFTFSEFLFPKVVFVCMSAL